MDHRASSVTVPQVLVELAKRVVRAFYGRAAGYPDELSTVLVDLLIRSMCVKEDEIVQLLNVERKTVVSRLSVLIKEHLVQKKVDVDPDAPPPEEGEAEMTVTYYYIDYEMLVNAVRLRLHLMQEGFRRKTDRDVYSRPKAMCTGCGRGYMDTEMDRLLDPFTGALRCADDTCGAEVEYDDSKQDVEEEQTSAQSARFNEQMNPFLELLRQAEKETIVAAIAAPAPVRKMTAGRGGRTGGLKDPLRGFAANTTTTIDFTDSDRGAVHKQQPLLHTAAALGSEFAMGAVADSGIGHGAASETGRTEDGLGRVSKVDDEAILALLRPKEPVTGGVGAAGGEAASTQGRDVAAPPVAESRKRPAEEEDDEDEDEVEVQGVAIRLSRVTDADVARMTPDEKQFYLELKELNES